ncbi:hypothetical protein BH23ACT2_BH23ACT2_24280 [soil metagenome]
MSAADTLRAHLEAVLTLHEHAGQVMADHRHLEATADFSDDALEAFEWARVIIDEASFTLGEHTRPADQIEPSDFPEAGASRRGIVERMR